MVTRTFYWLPGGNVAAGEFPGWRSDTTSALGHILDAGVSSFVDLTQETDPLSSYLPILGSLAAERGISVEYRRIAIRDMDVPSPETMTDVLAYIDAEVAAGHKVYVHCWGGIGRTGTVAGCYLARERGDGERALEAVQELFSTTEMAAWYEGGSPQTEDQRQFVLNWPSVGCQGRAENRDP